MALACRDGGATIDGTQHVAEHGERRVRSPDEATAEEGGEEEDAVGELEVGAGPVELVEEPVDVEERGGKFVEDKGWSVKVDEGSL